MKFKRKEGITLIALVITIIVLLILAGVTIATLTGDNGILTRAQEAKEENEKAEIIEQIRLDISDKQIENQEGSINEDEFYEILGKYGTISADKTILTTTKGNYEILISDIYLGSLNEGEHINFYCQDGSVELFQLDKRTFYTKTRQNAQKAFFTDANELDITAPTSSGIGAIVIGINDTEYLTLTTNNTANNQAIIRRSRTDNTSIGQVGNNVNLNYNDLTVGRFLFKIIDDSTILVQKQNNDMWEDYYTITLPSGYTTKLGISNVPSNKVVYINNYYIDSTITSTNWSGLKATFYGDSITKDVNKYQYTVGQILGLDEVYSCGKGGAQLTNYLSLEENYTSIPTDSDLIFVMAGTNDYGGQVEIGTVDDTSDENTFCGALNKLCQALTTGDYSNAKVVFGTPIHRAQENESITYSQYCNAIKDVCSKYDIPVIDLYNNCGITSENASEYLEDGVHPNIEGATLMGNYIAKELLEIQP